ncbi:MAG: PglZ domain-containing protein [Muribaculaceae bacterium]|nr:PglZ domain-containing protein [Muribaculaceae bacterium]
MCDHINIVRPSARIIWADDEIDLLKPHILFLKARGYQVTPVTSGADTLDAVSTHPGQFDIVFLDENMPGLSGLDTIDRLKSVAPHIPVVLITKNEDEHIMDLALGNRIADYLIKPVNPNQILLSLKKVLQSDRLIVDNDTRRTRERYTALTAAIDAAGSIAEWHDIYRRLTADAVDLAAHPSDTAAINLSLIDTANEAFFRFVTGNYISWIASRGSGRAPIMSPDVLDTAILPLLRQGRKPVLLLLDNFTLDQWIIAKPLFTREFHLASDALCTAILPTSTQYCRNAIMSGLLPADIATRFPALWVSEESSQGKNLHEETLLRDWIDRRHLSGCTLAFFRTARSASLRAVARDWHANSATLTVITVSFTDMLAHSIADNAMMRELAPSDSAYRSLLLSWLSHSPLNQLLSAIAASGRPLVVTTDHGSIKVANPVKVSARSDASAALRYKFGRNISAPSRHAFQLSRPSSAGLPSPALASSCIIAGRRDFFLYPNDFNTYARTFAGSYQHGGISMQEMILPLVTLLPK